MTDVTVDIEVGAIVQEVRKAVNPGIRAVAQAVADKARATSAFIDRSGKLRESIRVEDPGPESPFVLVKAGGYSFGSGKNYAPHAHLIEFGHVQTTPSGRVTGFTPARPFMLPAAYEVEQRAEEIAAASMDPIDIEVG